MTLLRLFLIICLCLPLCAFRPGVFDGMQVAGWSAPSWTSSAGSWSPNPPSGTEMLTDGGLEAWNDTTNLTNWSKVIGGTGSVNREGTTIHGGTYACRLDIDAGNGNTLVKQTLTATKGQWVVVDWWLRSSASAKTGRIQVDNMIGPARDPGTTYTNYTETFQCWVTNPVFNLKRASAASASLYFDDISCKPLTFTDLIAIRNFGKQKAISAALTIPAGLQGGVISRYSDANNYVLCWHDGTNLYLDMMVGGTLTNLISTAAAYADGRVIEIRWAAANTAQAWYNGVQVGTDQDVGAVPAGNWAGVFGTRSDVILANTSFSD